MNYVPVDVLVADQNKNPVAGAVLRLFSQDGKRVLHQYTTNDQGQSRFMLTAPSTVQVGVYKFGFSIQRLFLDILDAPAINKFVLSGETFIWPSATDARLCMAAGFFRDVSGAPKKHQDLHFVADFLPFVLEGSAVANERVSVRTDDDGYVEVNLIRHAIYGVTMEGMEDQFRRITVPDVASVNIAHLLFPRVERIDTTATLPVSVRMAKQVEVPLVVTTTDLRQLEDIRSDVSWKIADTNIAVIAERKKDRLILSGVARGSTQLIGERLPIAKCGNPPPVYYPDTPIIGVPIEVNVT